MTLSEEALQYVESHIPELAEQATRQAYWNTLASGDSVLVADDGKIWEVTPDGNRRFIKHITPPVVVTPQQPIYIIPGS